MKPHGIWIVKDAEWLGDAQGIIISGAKEVMKAQLARMRKYNPKIPDGALEVRPFEGGDSELVADAERWRRLKRYSVTETSGHIRIMQSHLPKFRRDLDSNEHDLVVDSLVENP